MLHSNSHYCYHWSKIDLSPQISNLNVSLFSHCVGEKFRAHRSDTAYNCILERHSINLVKVSPVISWILMRSTQAVTYVMFTYLKGLCVLQEEVIYHPSQIISAVLIKCTQQNTIYSSPS